MSIFQFSDGYGWMDMDSTDPRYEYDRKHPEKPHLDQYFASLAKSQGKSLHGLESFEECLKYRKRLNALVSEKDRVTS